MDQAENKKTNIQEGDDVLFTYLKKGGKKGIATVGVQKGQIVEIITDTKRIQELDYPLDTILCKIKVGNVLYFKTKEELIVLKNLSEEEQRVLLTTEKKL
ncbi:MAG: hypothetical protein KDB74_01350 [Flavobacteriales bacterium]|nr:hypothetical protein [Flavobacteriales bacterium]